MQQMIYSFLKGIGICCVLKKEICRDVICVLLIDFLGVDGNYYSFFVAYNETQIFTGEQECAIENTLRSCLKTFDKKEDFLKDAWSINPKKFLDSLNCTLQARNKCISNYTINDIVVISCKYYLYPTTCTIIHYSYEGVLQQPIIYQHGVMNRLNNGVPKGAYNSLRHLFQELNLTQIDLGGE